MIDPWTSIQAAAAKLLTSRQPGQAEPHRYALDRALRVVHTIDRLFAKLPKAACPVRVDLVRVAALYAAIPHVSPPKPRGAGSVEETLDDAAELAADQLPAHLSAPDVELTLRILREHLRKDTDLPEAQLLSDAIALEDVGLVGLWNTTRAFHAQGKTLGQLVKLWKTQHAYGYWATRLRDGFHFPIARALADERLRRVGEFYDLLLMQADAEDLA